MIGGMACMIMHVHGRNECSARVPIANTTQKSILIVCLSLNGELHGIQSILAC
jgi:hypothetical protein